MMPVRKSQSGGVALGELLEGIATLDPGDDRMVAGVRCGPVIYSWPAPV